MGAGRFRMNRSIGFEVLLITTVSLGCNTEMGFREAGNIHASNFGTA